MAALYLHNAIHAPDYDPNSSTSPHRRNVSSISNATLQSTSEFSHPTEPLLHPSTSESVAYLDLLSRQPTHPSVRRPEWTTSLSLDGDPVTPRERKVFRDHSVKMQLRRMSLYKGSLEIMMGAFAVYNTVRYFLAFTLYESIDGQAASLALGISTGASFAFLTCAFILSLFQPYLLSQHVPLRPLLRSRTAFHVLASLALFGPAVVNVALLFIWKTSPIKEINIQRRCHVDIDVVWSTSNVECQPPAWGVWIALSLLRLVITLFVIVSYHWIAIAYYRVRQPSFPRRRHPMSGVPSELYHSSLTHSVAASSVVVPQQSQLHSQHQSSDSTLRSNPLSKHSSNHRPSHLAGESSGHSDEDSEGTHNLESPDFGNFSHTNIENSDVELDSFHYRFRSLVSQINRETEEGLALARADNSGTPPHAHDAPPEDFDLPRVPPAIGYDEFGRPYPPDERVSFLNGYVRRMPTIESMGSREVGSMTASSIYTDRDTVTTSMRSTPVSRPPTRSNTLSPSEHSIGSRPPSRSNSIAAGAEILLGACRTSEVGELVDRPLGDTSRAESLLSSGSSYPSTMSYYTATSYGSAGPGNSTPPPASKH
ncbi:hypothetical protein D9615_007895 [Tricholomella constricta]|uniref:Uncharacterized protein n=1 Tax=Tricholomella constricta TaxID=117010 RepID=A0A8H5M0U8_9AGAR|nr:hypothetical protein D9615_007895 [Tricholomella constricta]